jgi:hypothetical protein
MVHSLVVIKEPLDTPVPDKPISFPKLEGLHLELTENKKKLKRNLPPIKIQPVKPLPPPKPEEPPKKKKEVEEPSKKKKEVPPKKEEDDADEEEPDDEGDEEPDIPEDKEDDEMIKELQDKEDKEAPDQPQPEQQEQTEPEDPYAHLSPEERERQEKEEYIWRYKILKRQYPKRTIPEYNEHDDLYTMKNSYDRTIKEIHLEVNVDSYRMYLIGGFWAVEFLCTNVLGVDMKGFASQQQAMMDKYERFLIELGERSYSRWGSNLPVELRLLGFIILQAGIFYVGKMMMSSGGVNMATLFNAMAGQAPQQKVDGGERKMKGPSIKVEEVRKAQTAQ